ncbi:MAG: hypothetical protein ABIF09_02110 [Gemmatimonadota bacterium]
MQTRFLWSDVDSPIGPVAFQPEEMVGLRVRNSDEWEEDEDLDEEEGWDEEGKDDEEDEDWEDEDDEDDEDWEDDDDDEDA